MVLQCVQTNFEWLKTNQGQDSNPTTSFDRCQTFFSTGEFPTCKKVCWPYHAGAKLGIIRNCRPEKCHSEKCQSAQCFFHPLGFSLRRWSSVLSQNSKTRWSFRFRRKTSNRLTKFRCFRVWNMTKIIRVNHILRLFNPFQ